MGAGETGVAITGVGETRTVGAGETGIDITGVSETIRTGGAGETGVDITGVGETGTVGTGKTGARSVENCAGAAESCAETLGNEGAASEAA